MFNEVPKQRGIHTPKEHVW